MNKRFALLSAACILFSQLSLSAATIHAAAPAIVAPAPPAKTHRVVFALTSGDVIDWQMTVGNIRNLIEGLKPDATEVEVVAYSQGLNLVKQGSSLATEIAELQTMHVRFVACQNSMRKQHVELKDLLPGVEPVPSGIVEVATKQEQGWSYIKAGR